MVKQTSGKWDVSVHGSGSPRPPLLCDSRSLTCEQSKLTNSDATAKEDDLKGIIAIWATLAAAIALVAWLMDSVDISGGVLGAFWVAAVFGLVNAVIGPVLRLLTLPLTVLTLGLFALVVNGILLAITAGLTDLLSVGSFLSTMVAALLISLFSLLLGFAFRKQLSATTEVTQ